jgi:hypothetical protein
MPDYPPEALTAATAALAAEPGIGDTTAARLYAEKALSAAAPHILADFSKRTAGMAEALNNAAAIIEDRDRQLAAWASLCTDLANKIWSLHPSPDADTQLSELSRRQDELEGATNG